MEFLPFEILNIIVNFFDYDIVSIISLNRTNRIFHEIISEKYNDLKKFTSLVRKVKSKARLTSREIAEKFNTEMSRLYIHINCQLLYYITNGKIGKVISLIDQEHADADYNSYETRQSGVRIYDSTLCAVHHTFVFGRCNAIAIEKFLYSRGMDVDLRAS